MRQVYRGRGFTLLRRTPTAPLRPWDPWRSGSPKWVHIGILGDSGDVHTPIGHRLGASHGPKPGHLGVSRGSQLTPPPTPTDPTDPTDSLHMVSSYFEGVDHVRGLALPQYLGFGPGSGAKACGPRPNCGPNPAWEGPRRAKYLGPCPAHRPKRLHPHPGVLGPQTFAI